MEDELRRLQLTQLEMLKLVDAICRKNDIKYSLYAGTLLGAVRHQGFIPWDDDLDVCMARNEYERFLEIWKEEQPAGYILQNKDNTPSFTQTFSKIRKEDTTFLQFDWERNRYHTGIFIDIFPVDRIPEKPIQKIKFKWNCMMNLLLTREFVPKEEGLILKWGSSILLKCIDRGRRSGLRKDFQKKIKQYNKDDALETVCTENFGVLNKLFPADMLNKYINLQFEDGEFMCFGDWHEHLQRKYGDYMKLPPEEDRTWKHHPIILDFEHNYEDLSC